MYSEEAVDKCTSAHVTISSSNFVMGNLRIIYEAVTPGYSSGKTISISCLGYKNPIYPDLWNGFRITLYDKQSFPVTQTEW
jgi:hypothetical protein